MRFFHALHLIHKGMVLIIEYLSLVSLHFFHPITLVYVTSCFLRLPWDHEIRCYLRQPRLEQMFEIWLTCRRCHISFSGICFFDAWRWFSDGCRWSFDFMEDTWCCLASHSTMHQLSYWGIFPYFEVIEVGWSFIRDMLLLLRLPPPFLLLFLDLLHWLILHFDFLVDCCWVGDCF